VVSRKGLNGRFALKGYEMSEVSAVYTIGNKRFYSETEALQQAQADALIEASSHYDDKDAPGILAYLLENAEKEIKIEYEGECFCCENPPTTSIILCLADKGTEHERIYIPNQGVRERFGTGDEPEYVGEVWFCSKCMRAIEDNLRATVLYLQSENKKP
jgi:hypothetical protein